MDDRSREDAVMDGDLASLSPAVQLERRDPGIDVPVAERALHPPPVAAHNGGESTIEAHYYYEVLGIESHLAAEQLPKSGLCWFLSEGRGTDIARRVEHGPKARLALRSRAHWRAPAQAEAARDAIRPR
jgi:hypothetical protein